jgi:hypothetical protein
MLSILIQGCLLLLPFMFKISLVVSLEKLAFSSLVFMLWPLKLYFQALPLHAFVGTPL